MALLFFKNKLVLLSFLVDSCVPGDIVTVSGVVKVNSVDEGKWVIVNGLKI